MWLGSRWNWLRIVFNDGIWYYRVDSSSSPAIIKDVQIWHKCKDEFYTQKQRKIFIWTRSLTSPPFRVSPPFFTKFRIWSQTFIASPSIQGDAWQGRQQKKKWNMVPSHTTESDKLSVIHFIISSPKTNSDICDLAYNVQIPCFCTLNSICFINGIQ